MESREGLLPKGIGDQKDKVTAGAIKKGSREGLLPKGIGDDFHHALEPMLKH